MEMKSKYSFLFLLSLFVFVLPLSGQKANKKKILTGYVTDANMNPVSGAMILIDKNRTNVSTDSRGYYKVKIKPDATLLTVFSVTTGAGEDSIRRRTSINIKLNTTQSKAKVKTETDNSVNIGYGSVDPKNSTQHINNIDNSGNKYDSYNNIYDMLKDAIPGAQVSGKSIIIQGITTFNSSTDALMVVNGFVVNSIDDIQPNEVKSIDVLKGSAASIYGSRGANGVVLITLKGAPNKK
jgi:Outer membrane receptor for ferrienterochelin and colicins